MLPGSSWTPPAELRQAEDCGQRVLAAVCSRSTTPGGRRLEFTSNEKRWFVAAGVVAAGLAACYLWADPYPLPYKVRDASVLGPVTLGDPHVDRFSVGSDDRTISLHVDWSGCDYKPDLVAKETADRVTMTLKRRDASGPGVGCEDGGIAQLTTSLHHPLGSRALVDGVTGRPIPVPVH